MKIKALREIQDLFRKQPRQVNMKVWAMSRENCGTVGCIAGWSEIIREMREDHSKTCNVIAGHISNNCGRDYMEAAGRRNFGLTGPQAKRLFYVEQWPFQYKERYIDAKNREDYSAITVERIDHFIKTKGKE